jgi:hypothetical protein
MVKIISHQLYESYNMLHHSMLGEKKKVDLHPLQQHLCFPQNIVCITSQPTTRACWKTWQRELYKACRHHPVKTKIMNETTTKKNKRTKKLAFNMTVCSPDLLDQWVRISLAFPLTNLLHVGILLLLNPQLLQGIRQVTCKIFIPYLTAE